MATYPTPSMSYCVVAEESDCALVVISLNIVMRL